jgi:outer membrane protein assembly factor BamB
MTAGLKRRLIVGLSTALLSVAIAKTGPAQSVLTYHGSTDRSGNYVVPLLSWERVHSLHLDPAFHFNFPGHLYAQPLYWQVPGALTAMLIVATEDNGVHAIEARSGKEIWTRSLGPPVPLSTQPCGNIDPLGITGTPVIDETTQALYLDAFVGDASGAHHRIFGLSLRDGSILPGWPVDVGDALAPSGQRFNRFQNQRGALTILDGRVYVPFGGHFGDCGDYRGWVIGVRLQDPREIVTWSTRGRGGGIWAPGGISSDGRSLFVATGNTLGASTWSDGEAVFRLTPDLRHNDQPKDFFAPSDWRALDARDADLGGTNPLLLEVPSTPGLKPLVLALGKDARAYLLDRTNLGGIGGSLAAALVSTYPIRTAPAAYSGDGGVFVAFQGQGADCPAPRRDNNLTVLKIREGSPPSITTAWCGAFKGGGSPIVTTTDGHSDPIVWILGAEGDGRLHGYRGDTGEILFSGGAPGDAMTGLRHFQTLLAAGDRLYVGADGRIYAFSYEPD